MVFDHINSPFRMVRFAEQTDLLDVNFGNVIKLLAADLPNATIPADESIDITLIWQALPPVTEEYSVSVQMIGENGRRVAQSDSFHPAGLPLPRWQANEYGRDIHRLTPSPATPPGNYRLVAFVYNIATRQRLNMLNEAGLSIYNEYELSHITLTSPSRFPHPADLTISKTNTEGGGTSPFLAENVQLLGFDAPLDNVEQGQMIPVTLYWHTLQTPANDYETDISIGCEGIETVSEPVKTITPIDSPNTTWQPGQIQRAEFDVMLIPVDQNGKPMQSGLCTLYLSLSTNEEVNSIALETFPVSAPERRYTLTALANWIRSEPSFGNLVTLIGFSLRQVDFTPGEIIPLTLYWRSDAPFDRSYKVFVHLFDENGRLIAQQDQIPANGIRPTTGWVPGEFVQDDYALVLPTDMAPGNYQLITGLYDVETGHRLPLADGAGDAITIPVSIEVKTAE